MKRSIKYIPIVLLLMAAFAQAMPAAAQYGPGPASDDRVDRHLRYLNARLDLTNEQEEQVRTILLEHHQEAVAWLQDHPAATRAERRAHRTEHQAALQEALGGVLTEAQVEELDDIQTAWASRRGDGLGMYGPGMRGRRGGRGMHGGRGGMGMGPCGMGGGAQWDGTMGGPGNARWMSRLGLTDEQREQLQDLQAEHRAEMRSALEEVLTDEQFAQFDSMRVAPRCGQGLGMRGRRGGAGGPGRGYRGMRGPGFGGRGGYMMGRLADALDLTGEQRTEVLQIMEQHRDEGRAWQAEHPQATPEERQAFMQAHHQMLLTKLEDVLSEEQLDQFDAMKARWQDRQPARDADDDAEQE